MKLTIQNDHEWTAVQAARAKSPRVRGAGGGGEPVFPEAFLRDGVSIDQVLSLSPKARRGAPSPRSLDLTVELEPGELAVVAMRAPSGALTFHSATRQGPPAVRAGGSRRGGQRSVARFAIAVPEGSAPDGEGPARRGIVSKAIKVVLLKVQEKILDSVIQFGIRKGVQLVESAIWKRRKLQEGWFDVDPATLISTGTGLSPATFDRLQRKKKSLLLLHGTFSNAQAAFKGLASAGDFFTHARRMYEGRIFAFNHFSLSRTPAENAKMLLESLPDGPHEFDVVSHSRGGLVLRELVERRDAFGTLANRFRLGHGVLVAVPNRGTPLASPGRWDETFGLVANFLEMFPDNPWTTAPELIAESIAWIAGKVTVSIPGIAAMDRDGEAIEELRLARPPSAGTYSAVAANYQPDGVRLARLLDLAVDSFFGTANDLVVPTEGSWQLDERGSPIIPDSHVACYGPGGNVRSASGTNVNHVNIFEQPQTGELILRALSGRPLKLIPIGADTKLPAWTIRSGRRRAPSGAPGAPAETVAADPRSADRRTAVPSLVRSDEPLGHRGDPLNILLVESADCEHQDVQNTSKSNRSKRAAQVIAVYGSARVVENFPTRNPPKAKSSSVDAGDAGGNNSIYGDGQAGTRFQGIIGTHKDIRTYLEGERRRDGSLPDLPEEQDLLEFGKCMFECLFTGDVRRLYDAARSEQQNGVLNVIFTSAIPWLAELPWEFAYDPTREKFLVMEEIHFVRNAFTPVPAQRRPIRRGPLRILVAAASPVTLYELSVEEEQQVIRNDFDSLLQTGLVTMDVISRTTPESLHEQIQMTEYDIVHFVGHGDFDREASRGTLIFESPDGGSQEVDASVLKQILCGRGIRLVFLNACESARDEKDRINRGIAQALMQGGMPAIVANQYPVLDPSAVRFAKHFYWSLARGSTLGQAAREARISLRYSPFGEIIDWAVPVLFSRDPDDRFCERREAPRKRHLPTRFTPRPSRVRRSAGGRSGPRVVGVADLDRAFVDLEPTLNRLNQVQDEFSFRCVQFYSPLGNWLVNDIDDGDSKMKFIYADRFARRHKKTAENLGVDSLICFTGWPMVCDIDGDLVYHMFEWWDDTNQPLILFSVEGFPIPPRGEIADRVVANAIATGLAGQLSGHEAHERGPKTCPFYYNEERDFELISGTEQFDKGCADLLRRKLGRERLGALEAILDAFPESRDDVLPPAKSRSTKRKATRPRRKKSAK